MYAADKVWLKYPEISNVLENEISLVWNLGCPFFVLKQTLAL